MVILYMYVCIYIYIYIFLVDSAGKESACNAEDAGNEDLMPQ